MTELPENPAFPDPGELPVVDWISKDVINVDASYQRGEDMARAEKIARAFSWSKFGAVVVVPREDGRYAIIDGQHRMLAAKMHPLVDNLPAVIMPAVKGTAAEATSFIGLNAERKAVSGLELFHARRAAGDEDAETIDQVLARAGVTVPRYPAAKYQPGETIAVNVVHSLINRRGAMRAREYLQILAECAPITANQIKATELLMTDPEFAGWLDPEELTATVKSMGAMADAEAKRFAATHCVATWKGLANVWFQKCKKRRHRVEPSAAPTVRSERKVGQEPASGEIPHIASSADRPQISTPPPRHRTFVPNTIPAARNVTASICGDPEPGRSALDQRKVRA